MKTAIFLTLSVILASNVFGQAKADEHTWKATARVVDENLSPLSNATVKVGYFDKNTPVEIVVTTDTNGIFTATHTTSTSDYVEYTLAFLVSREGYYNTFSKFDLGLPYDAQKWNPTVTITLKKIRKPIGMFAKYVNSEPSSFKKTGQPPIVVNKTIGYDLMAGDWIAPYGKGVKNDMIFTEVFNKKSVLDYDFKFTISFPNKGDGIQEYTVPEAEKGSGLRSPHEAPIDGYQPQLIRENFHHPDGTGKTDYDVNRIFFFRVRTVEDDKGNIVSAQYGKNIWRPADDEFSLLPQPYPKLEEH